MSSILLSGFRPFGRYLSNPSMELVHRFHGRSFSGVEIIGSILPVVREKSWQELHSLIETHQPCVVLCLGVSSRPMISLERFAINRDDFPIPDNEGNQPRNQRIIDAAPDCYQSTLPLKQLHCESKQRTMLQFSDSAGSYVCNHLFFQLQHGLRNTDIASGFIHVPHTEVLPLCEQSDILESILQILSERECRS